MRTLRSTGALLAFLLFANACGENAVGAAEFLAGSSEKSWELQAITTGGIDEFLNDCERSLVLTFKADGSWTSDFTDAECTPDPREGTWAFNATNTELTIGEGGLEEIWEILELSEDALRYRRDEGSEDQVVRWRAAN
jgi:hypothetical protein